MRASSMAQAKRAKCEPPNPSAPLLTRSDLLRMGLRPSTLDGAEASGDLVPVLVPCSGEAPKRMYRRIDFDNWLASLPKAGPRPPLEQAPEHVQRRLLAARAAHARRAAERAALAAGSPT